MSRPNLTSQWLTININPKLKKEFKLRCAMIGVTITDVLTELIQEWVTSRADDKRWERIRNWNSDIEKKALIEKDELAKIFEDCLSQADQEELIEEEDETEFIIK